MRLLLLAAALALACACGAPKPTPDAGPDTSCGLDCAAQDTYGLVLNRCFEYSADRTTAANPPALGVWVQEKLFELEGGIKTIEVQYRQGGQTLQTDYFTFKNGDLTLMRRIAGTQSVTYKTDGAITGVKWLSMDTGAGANISTSTTAFLSRDNSSTATDYRVTTSAPSTTDKRTPLSTYENGVQLIFGETPDHGSDARRIFVPNVGFTLLSSPFSLLGGTPTPVYLQRIRDIGTADAGAELCSMGAP